MIDELWRRLAIAPVMGHFHPLLPLCVPPETDVQPVARAVAAAMDDLAPNAARPILITAIDQAYSDRFMVMDMPEMPDAAHINAGLPRRLGAARSLLTQRCVVERITADTQRRGYRTVALLLIDGLSYEDARHWPEAPEPVFIDGPSITYFTAVDGHVLPDVGFPAIVGRPPLAHRLAALGLGRARGYSYWARESNAVAALMFDGMPLQRVGGIAQALTRLAGEPLNGLYVQIVRVGTDGLAHGRREVSLQEVAATVEAVREDLLRVVDLLRRSELPGAVYLVSDHGLLWKHAHALREMEGLRSDHPRYAAAPLADDAPVTRFEAGGVTFSLFHYPHLGAPFRANNSGVHGGLSYWESIVPFVHVEVNL